jgi:hypothetical protein
MTKMLLGYRCADDVALTPTLAAKAHHRLAHDLAFVGLTEEWDASVCLFHQMLGGHAREIEFLNYRAGKMTRAKPLPADGGGAALVRPDDRGSSSSSSSSDSEAVEGSARPPPPPALPAAASGEKKYDVAVHVGLRDQWDEQTYVAARAAFTANVRAFASCPAQRSARFSVEHILNPREGP